MPNVNEDLEVNQMDQEDFEQWADGLIDNICDNFLDQNYHFLDVLFGMEMILSAWKDDAIKDNDELEVSCLAADIEIISEAMRKMEANHKFHDDAIEGVTH